MNRRVSILVLFTLLTPSWDAFVLNTPISKENSAIGLQAIVPASLTSNRIESGTSVEIIQKITLPRRAFLREGAIVLGLGTAFRSLLGAQRPADVQRQRILTALRHLLTQMETNGWLAPGPGWTANDRAVYITKVRAFLANPDIAPSTDRPSQMWVDPITHKRIFFRLDVVTRMADDEIERVIAHELVHTMPRQIALFKAENNARRAASGHPVDDATARDLMKHSFALQTTMEAEGWAMDVRIVRNQAAALKMTVDGFVAQRMQHMADPLGLRNLGQINRIDPLLSRPQSRASLVLNVRVVLSVNMERMLNNLYQWEVAHGVTRLPIQSWLASWVADPKYAELRPTEKASLEKGPGGWDHVRDHASRMMAGLSEINIRRAS